MEHLLEIINETDTGGPLLLWILNSHDKMLEQMNNKTNYKDIPLWRDKDIISENSEKLKQKKQDYIKK